MSLENDITHIKNSLSEQENPVFKAASPEQLSKREEARKADIQRRIAANKLKGPPWVGHEKGICPRCGSDNIDYTDTDEDSNFIFHEFTCSDCGADGYEESVVRYKSSVIEEDPDKRNVLTYDEHGKLLKPPYR